MLNKETKQKLNEYFKKRMGAYDYGAKGWMKTDCPECGKHKFGIHLGNDRTNCFYCDYKPKPVQLIMDQENFIKLSEVYELLGQLDGMSYREEEVVPFELKEKTVLPEGYRNILRGDSTLARAARKFVKKRGFDVNKMSRKGWGYGTKDKYFGYLIMPFYDNNRLTYFNARLFCGSGPKFNNPDVEEFGLGKSFIIYNREALFMYKTVWLVESVTNAETIGDNATAFGGKSLSRVQINEVIKSPCEKVVIGLDRDAIDKAIKLAFELINYKKVKVVIMPDARDINDWGKAKSKKLSYKTHYLTSFSDVIRLKNQLR